MPKSRAHYTYTVFSQDGYDIVAIVDNDTGMSVTNDIENVMSDIAEEEGIEIISYLVIYRDSAGQWDGWDWDTQWFTFLHAHTQEDAVNNFISLKNKRQV